MQVHITKRDFHYNGLNDESMVLLDKARTVL